MKPILALLIGMVVAFATGEIAVRALGTWDLDGNFTLYRTVRPRKLRLKSVAANLAENALRPTRYATHDPVLGWTIRPQGRSENGVYMANSRGIRSAPTEYTPTPEPGRLRIVLLGDSFTHGNDIPFEDTWGALLESRMRAAGVDVEILNLAVVGYGYDQIYLRWKELGRSLEPHIVIFGFCQGDVARVVSFHWSFWHPTFAGQYTKPRFRLDAENALQALNLPTVPPERIVDWLRAFPDGELAQWEEAFRPYDYEDHFWLSSKLLALAEVYLFDDRNWGQERGGMWAPGVEAGRVSAALIEALRADVQAHGAEFITINLPWRPGLEHLRRGGPAGAEPFLSKLAESSLVLRAEHALIAEAERSSMDSLFLHGGYGHYNRKADEIVARLTADELLSGDVLERFPLRLK